MAQNITLMGASYSDVPSILLPKTGGGTAKFSDPSVTTATAADVASGKIFLLADGSQGTGTASGGSSWTRLGYTDLTVNTTSTSAAQAGTIDIGASAWTHSQIILVRIRDKAGPRAGYHYGSDAWFSTNYIHANGSTSTLSAAGRIGLNYSSSNTWSSASASYGVYGYSISSAGVVTIRRRYNSSYTGTINGTFRCEVYALDYPDGKSPFNTGAIT